MEIDSRIDKTLVDENKKHGFVGANLYGIIPAAIRYHKELNSDEKLLYAEITALVNTEKYFICRLDHFYKHFPDQWNHKTLMRAFSTLEYLGVANLEILEEDKKNPLIKITELDYFLGIPEDYLDE